MSTQHLYVKVDKHAFAAIVEKDGRRHYLRALQATVKAAVEYGQAVAERLARRAKK